MAARPLSPALYRHLGIAYRDRNLLPLAARYFIEYLVECNEAGFIGV